MKLNEFIRSSNLTCDHCAELLDKDDFVRVQYRGNGQTVGIVCWGCSEVYVSSLRLFPLPSK